MIHIVAAITAHPGKRDEILKVLRPGLARVKDIPGCIEYTVVVDTDATGAMHEPTKFGPDTFVCIEKWETMKDLVAHAAAPETAEYFKVIEPYFKSRSAYILEGI